MDKEKQIEEMAEIIAEHLCPQGRAHKTLYGAARRCYSRNNFADCEKVSDCVDALIAAGIGEVSAQKAEQEEIKLFNAEIKNGEIDMTVGGAGFKTFFALIEQMFKQNGATAFLTTTIEGGNDIKYAVTIQRVGEKSPAEELRQATELWKHEKHRAEVAEKERDEWKERAEKAGNRLKIAKQKLKKTNMCYGTARLEHLNGDPYEILCPHCGENIKFHVSNTCPYCNALLFKKTGREEKDKYSDILQLKSFCERNGIKCILTRRIEDFKGKLKERDGYKITFLNGDVIQCADTNGYFEFYNCHNEVDGKWIELPAAKSFVLRYKNWLDLNNKPKREIEEEGK